VAALGRPLAVVGDDAADRHLFAPARVLREVAGRRAGVARDVALAAIERMAADVKPQALLLEREELLWVPRLDLGVDLRLRLRGLGAGRHDETEQRRLLAATGALRLRRALHGRVEGLEELRAVHAAHARERV